MHIFKTIRTKISVSILAIFLLFLGAYTLYQVDNIRKHAFITLDSMNTTINSMLVEYTSAYIYNKNIISIKQSIDVIDSEYIKAIYILDQNGFVIAKNKTDEVPFTKYSKFDTLVALKNTSIKSSEEYTVLNTFKILDVPIGYMVVEASLKNYNEHIQDELDTLILVALFSSALFLVATILIARSLSYPIEEIINTLQNTKDDEVLELRDQPQEEFKYLSAVITSSHERLRNSNIYLEKQVSVKTNELQLLNSNLEVKIKEAIAEVEHKNAMLKQNSRMAQMGEMISMIAHQWRQPLAAISAVCIDLRMKINLEDFNLKSEKGREEFIVYTENSLISIDGFVQNLTQTVDDFRSFHRTDKVAQTEGVEVPISKAFNIIRNSLLSDNILIQEEYLSQLSLKLYTNELMQVVLNILKNSQDNFNMLKEKKKAVTNAKIKIKTYDTLKHAVIEIEDNGGGIKDEFLEKIYDPYFSTKDKKNGTGLGLYMSRTIIQEHHKGELYAYNSEEGVCFVIKLKLTL